MDENKKNYGVLERGNVKLKLDKGAWHSAMLAVGHVEEDGALHVNGDGLRELGAALWAAQLARDAALVEGRNDALEAIKRAVEGGPGVDPRLAERQPMMPVGDGRRRDDPRSSGVDDLAEFIVTCKAKNPRFSYQQVAHAYTMTGRGEVTLDMVRNTYRSRLKRRWRWVGWRMR